MQNDIQQKLHPGPVAIIINEDDIAIKLTVSHLRGLGFVNLIVFGRTDPQVDGIVHLAADPSAGLAALIAPILPQLKNRWVYWGYNAEYLFFPFCEARTISDAAQFVAEERREAVFATVLDLYAGNLAEHPSGIDRDSAHFDASGYFARDRYDGPTRIERQIHIHGGLKWRFAEHVPWENQPIERIPFFRARDGVTIDDRGRLSEPEMNTHSAAWHHSMTFAIASFRTAKSLMTNPGSAEAITSLSWSGSTPFAWNSTQLMEHGLMEPGQWF